MFQTLIPVGPIPKPAGQGTRPSLPLDPILQLLAGQINQLPDVVAVNNTPQIVAPANPSRVALYIMPGALCTGMSVYPVGGSIPVAAVTIGAPALIRFDTRDYPGLAQGAWLIVGQGAGTVSVWEYALSPSWTL